MIAKIILENFMAHELTEIELGPGVTALTGPNNTGKSAVVEALRCLATNPVPKHFIRHGAKEARVSVVLEDGTKVVWIRKKRSSGYELWRPGAEEPEEYWKFGRKPPEDVLQALKLDLVELETGTEIDVHLGNQREPVFLLNQPSSNAAAFFAASTESAHLLAMQNLLKRKTQDAKRREKDILARMDEIECRMEHLSPLPEISLEAARARSLQETAKMLGAVVPTLENSIARQALAEKRLVSMSQTAKVLEKARPAENLQDTRQLDDAIRRMKTVDHNLDEKRLRAKKLAKLVDPAVTYDTNSLATMCQRLGNGEKLLQKAEEIKSRLLHLYPVKELNSTMHLSGLIDELVQQRTRLKRVSHRSSTLENVVEPPRLVDLAHLEALLAQMGRNMDLTTGREDTVRALETELKSLRSKIEDRVRELGDCPTCGAPMDAAHYLDREHGNDA